MDRMPVPVAGAAVRQRQRGPRLTHALRRPTTENGQARDLLLLTLVRVALNTGLRFVYPFLPALARGVGVSTRSLSQVVALRALAGLIGPAVGSISDRRGRRPVMVAALLLMALGCSMPALAASLGALALALIAIAMAKAIFDPALQGWVADRVPYASRGRAIAVTELSWAAALLLGAPACGWLIGAFGWRAPFVALGLAAGAGALAVMTMLAEVAPPDAEGWRRTKAGPAGPTADGAPRGLDPPTPISLGPLALLRTDRSIRALTAFIVCLMLGNELLLVVFGEWLESAFGLRLGALGLAGVVIGFAELGGELGVATIADRLGKRRLVLGAGLLAALAYLGLPRAGDSLPLALGLLFIVFLGFELCYVGFLPIATELAPGSRGALMSIVTAATSLGRALGASAGGWLYDRGGLGVCSLTAAGLTLLALGLLLRGVAEPAGR